MEDKPVNAPRILVVDDEPQIRRALQVTLRANGYEVEAVGSGQEALDAAAVRPPDLIVLDLNLPDISGIEVCRQIREWSHVPIVVLSVLGDDYAKIRAFDEGADDYVTKPFSVPELLARMRVALRHASMVAATEERVVRAGEIEIDLVRRIVVRSGEEIHLTPTEYALVRYLAQHRGRIITHGQLLHSVLGTRSEDSTGPLRVHIAGLRKKLERDSAHPEVILTEPGVGYRFRAE